jgi:hypothetical protein
MSRENCNNYDGELIAEVDYNISTVFLKRWGELTLSEYKKIAEGNGYIIEHGRRQKGAGVH